MLSDRQATWIKTPCAGDIARQIASGEAVQVVDPKSDPHLVMQMLESMRGRSAGVHVRGKAVRYVDKSKPRIKSKMRSLYFADEYPMPWADDEMKRLLAMAQGARNN